MDKITTKENEDPKMNEVKLKDKLLKKLVKENSIKEISLLELFNNNTTQIKKVVTEFEIRELANTIKVNNEGIGISKLFKTDNAEAFMSVGGFYKEYIDKIDKETKVEEDRNLSNNGTINQMRTNKRNGVGTIILICISALALGVSIIALLKQ